MKKRFHLSGYYLEKQMDKKDVVISVKIVVRKSKAYDFLEY